MPTNRIIPKLIEPIDGRICSKLLIDAIEQVLESRKNRPMCPIRGSCFLNYITNFTIGIPASRTIRFIISLSIPTADPSTEAPTNGTSISFNKP